MSKISSSSLVAIAFSLLVVGAGIPLEAKASDDTRFDYTGIVRLPNCSASLVRFDDSDDNDLALVLTNGHCVSYNGFYIQPGTAIANLKKKVFVDFLGPDGSSAGSAKTESLVYATMSESDLALYKLPLSYGEIRSRFNVEALVLSSVSPEVGLAIEIASGYWKRVYQCQVEAVAFSLQEADWFYSDSVRYSRPGCEVIGGTSGSPVIAAGTRTVVAINNSVNEKGRECSMGNPCEIDEDGTITAVKGYAYAQQTAWLYDCRRGDGALDFTLDSCRLPKPIN